MESKDLAGLEAGFHSNNTHPASFFVDGEFYARTQVRYRGAFARSWPKKPLKIFFPDDRLFRGSDRLNLNSGWRDPALVREHLAYQVYTACGAPASASRMARLDLNGEFRGLYVEVEQPDKAFARRLNLKGATIYKAFSRSNQADERDLGEAQSYRSHYEKETQKENGYEDLQGFCRELASGGKALDFFARHVDLEKYVNYLAASTLTQNWDAYNKNHFLVFDGRGSGKWFVVPWDLDRTFGDSWDWSFDKANLPILLGTRQIPGVTGWNRLQDRFFSDKTLRTRFMDRLSALLEEEFTPEKLFPLLDKLETELGPLAVEDRKRWGGANVHKGIAQVKEFIKRRRAYLLKELGNL